MGPGWTVRALPTVTLPSDQYLCGSGVSTFEPKLDSFWVSCFLVQDTGFWNWSIIQKRNVETVGETVSRAVSASLISYVIVYMSMRLQDSF